MKNTVTQRKNPKKKSPVLIWGLAVGGFVVVMTLVTMFLLQNTASKSIDSFETCKNAGGSIAESYPEQCFLHGKSFVNDSQIDSNVSAYVGLSEQYAMNKAKSAGIAHRVVERDDELLAITMDFSYGRLNFHIKNDKVYKVDVEGIGN